MLGIEPLNEHFFVLKKTTEFTNAFCCSEMHLQRISNLFAFSSPLNGTVIFLIHLRLKSFYQRR